MNKDNKKCVDIDISAHMGECENRAATPITTPIGVRLINVPVVLAERTISTNLVANIKFPEPVLEIKDIKKQVKIVFIKFMCSLLKCVHPVVILGLIYEKELLMREIFNLKVLNCGKTSTCFRIPK